jgi:hypothetical protein
MAALLVQLTVLASAFNAPVQFLQNPGVYPYAAAPAAPLPGRAIVIMNTKYGDPKVLSYRKADPKTGSTKGLFGYTVGSRAPPRAIASGERAEYGYGIDNLYGGKKFAKITQKVERRKVADSVGSRTNILLGGSGATAIKSGLKPTGIGPILCWGAIIIFIGCYFKYAYGA